MKDIKRSAEEKLALLHYTQLALSSVARSFDEPISPDKMQRITAKGFNYQEVGRIFDENCKRDIVGAKKWWYLTGKRHKFFTEIEYDKRLKTTKENFRKFMKTFARLVAKDGSRLSAYRAAKEAKLPQETVANYVRGTREGSFMRTIKILKAYRYKLLLFKELADDEGEVPYG